MPRRLKPNAVVCALLMTAAIHALAAQSADSLPPWKISGYYLNLLSRSRTVVPAAQDFTLDLNRLRLRLEGEPIKHLAIDVQYDNEMLVGNYLSTQQYALSKDRAPPTSLDLARDYVTRDNLVARHRLYRATASWAAASADVKVGRQRVALGTGQFWSPLDLINPIDPTRLERDYRAGVDAMLVERKVGALARLDGVYAPATERSKAIAAGYAHGNLRGTDYSLLIGTFRGDDAIGADFSSSTGGLGFRGEATMTNPAQGRQYGRALLGADYGFPNTLNLTAELYYNGQGTSDPARYDLAALFAGRMANVGRGYGAIAVSYGITPLVKISGYGVLNVDDRSGVLWPRIEYSEASNILIAAGIQRFIGGPQSEYGRFSNLLHAELRWFF
jgi:opacity protein-like surface antigen